MQDFIETFMYYYGNLYLLQSHHNTDKNTCFNMQEITDDVENNYVRQQFEEFIKVTNAYLNFNSFVRSRVIFFFL